MTTSKDRVQFYLPHRYFAKCHSDNHMSRDDCKKVLGKAFSLGRDECGHLMDRNPNGFTIVCRPSQFARFIIFRHLWGHCINGVRDLEPELQPKDNFDPYARAARELHMERSCVREVAEALGFVPSEKPRPNMIDVSKRPDQSCC